MFDKDDAGTHFLEDLHGCLEGEARVNGQGCGVCEAGEVYGLPTGGGCYVVEGDGRDGG